MRPKNLTPTLCILFFTFCVIAGCSTAKLPLIERGGADLKELTVQNSLSLQQAVGVDILRAYHGDETVYLKIGLIFSESNSSRAIYIKSQLKTGPDEMGSVTTHNSAMEFMLREDFLSAVKGLRQAYIMTDDVFHRLHSEILHSLISDRPQTGIAITNGRQTLVYYYNQHGELNSSVLDDLPEGMTIVREFEQEAFNTAVFNKLEAYFLSERTVRGRTAVIINGFSGRKNTVPFIFVDRSRKSITHIHFQQASEYTQSVIGKSIRTADTLILQGQIIGMLTRPVSSAFRLFAWTKDTAYELLSPKAVELLEKPPVPPVSGHPPMDLNAWEQELDKVAPGVKTKGEVISYHIGGESFFSRLEEVIQNAQKSILIRIFIFDNDDFAVRIADLLKQKSLEDDVEVKVLLDGMGILMGEGKVPASLPRGFVPPGSMKNYLTQDSNIQVRVRSNVFFNADHIKTIIIDGEVGFTGGMNIGREYRYDWHDMMMELTGPVLGEFRRDFDIAWAHASKWGDVGYVKEILSPGRGAQDGAGLPIRLLYTRANDPQIYKAQLAAIRNARSYIYIHNSYFSDNAILYELIKARRRGVDVRVVLPVNGNHEIMNASNKITANIMFRNGIRVYFYPGMSHIKAAIFDGWLCTGSANFDKLSLRDNLEMNLGISDPKTVNRLKDKLFRVDFERSDEMTKEFKNSLSSRLAEFIADQL